MITIWAKGKMNGNYREDIGQVSFSTGWLLSDALEHVKAKYPDAEQYIIGESGNGGLVSGWERDAAPGY
jgi:hypothetical protein